MGIQFCSQLVATHFCCSVQNKDERTAWLHGILAFENVVKWPCTLLTLNVAEVSLELVKTRMGAVPA